MLTLQATVLEALQNSGEFLILADKIIYLRELLYSFRLKRAQVEVTF